MSEVQRHMADAVQEQRGRCSPGTTGQKQAVRTGQTQSKDNRADADQKQQGRHSPGTTKQMQAAVQGQMQFRNNRANTGSSNRAEHPVWDGVEDGGGSTG
eukprot:1158585-Pelagomonas_calceolata.AAC.3